MTIHWLSDPKKLSVALPCIATDDIWVLSGEVLRHMMIEPWPQAPAHAPHCLAQDCAELEITPPEHWVVWQDDDFIEVIANHEAGLIQW